MSVCSPEELRSLLINEVYCQLLKLIPSKAKTAKFVLHNNIHKRSEHNDISKSEWLIITTVHEMTLRMPLPNSNRLRYTEQRKKKTHYVFFALCIYLALSTLLSICLSLTYVVYIDDHYLLDEV